MYWVNTIVYTKTELYRTGVLSSASVPSIPTSELLETEEPIREQNLQEAIRQSGALIDDEKYQLLFTEQDGTC